MQDVAEFCWGDRVKWIPHPPPGVSVGETWSSAVALGTVVDERNQNTIMGDFDECLPLPVAVLWDEPGEVWWTPGTELEMA